MATLEKIRNKAGVLVAVVIGLSLLAFILTDFLSNGSSLLTGSKMEVAEIAGKSISVQEFEQKVSDLEEIYKINTRQGTIDEATREKLRNQTWEEMVNSIIMDKEYNKIGLGVSADELFDLVQGSNPHPIVRQIFTNPNTGQFDHSNLIRFLKNMDQDPSGKTFWLYIENQVRNSQLNSKYNFLVQKGLDVPTFMAKDEYINSNRKVDMDYIVERLSFQSDSTIKITSGDLKEYYDKHKYMYEQSTSRSIEYVSYDIVASEADKKADEEWITKIKPDFEQATDVEQFVNSNSDVSYFDKNYSPSDLTDSLREVMFSKPEGYVYGPYLENETYKLARLYKIVYLPDSVKARHILIQPKGQQQADVQAAKSLADSIKGLLDKGANFEALAKQYSDDKSNADKGGDLGWFKDGMMVKPFNDAAFSAKKGEISVVETQFGFHILQVLDRSKEEKKVKIAFLERKIEASSQTYQMIYSQASKFAADNNTYDKFNAAIAKENLTKRIADDVGENAQTMSGIDKSAKVVVRWMYKADLHDVSEPLDLGDRYIVAALTQIKEKGIAPLEQVKNDVLLNVRKQKQLEKIAEKMSKAKAGVTHLGDLALKLNLPVDTAHGIAFTSYTLGGMDIEPKVIAYASNSNKAKISDPIIGNNGVYVINILDVTEPAEVKDYSMLKMRLDYAFQSRTQYECFGALRKLADINDERYKFY